MTSLLDIEILLAIILVIISAGTASATCQASYDYCANITYTLSLTDGWYTIDLANIEGGIVGSHPPLGSGLVPGASICRGSICKNLDGGYYAPLTDYSGNLYGWVGSKQNVYVALGVVSPGHMGGLPFTPVLSGPYLANSNNTFIFQSVAGIPTLGSPPTIWVKICLNGTNTTSYGYARNDNTTTQTITPVTADFTPYYRRKWTFLNDSGSPSNFTNQSATLTIVCPTLSSFGYNLSATPAYNTALTVQTTEQPYYIANLNGNTRTRTDIDHFLADNYYTQSQQTQYSFTLLDYTGQCFGPLVFKKSIGDNQVIIDSTTFDPSRIATAFLDNATYYDISVLCANGGLRDFGNWMLGTTLSRNIEVTNVPLNPSATVYAGGFMPMLLGNNTNTITFAYSKTTGLVTSINFTVQDISGNPPVVVYSQQLGYSSNGQINYIMNNSNSTYYASYIAVNEGQTIMKGEVFRPVNLNATTTTLPPTILGAQSDTIYKSAALIGMGIMGLGWAAIDAGYGGIAMVAWILLMSNIPRFDGSTGWIQVPGWLQVTIGLMMLGLLWGMNRRHDE